MPSYKAPVDDVRFLLDDVFHIERYANLPGFADASPDVIAAILEEAAKYCEHVLTPLNRIGDKQGCTRHDDGSVTTPQGFKDAFKQIVEGGWIGISAPTEFGGQGLPMLMTQLVNEFLCSANMSFAMYPGLTQGAIAGADRARLAGDQGEAHSPKMVAGEWTGTMNLTEPQCGTDLGLIRTKAAKQGDGSFKITGTKIFISAGEHDLAPNIISIWCWRASKARQRATRASRCSLCSPWSCRTPTARLARATRRRGLIEEKMGIHGNATCVP